MAEEQSSFNPILAGGEREEPGSRFSQRNPLFDETRISKRGLVAKGIDEPEGGSEVELVERQGTWLKEDRGFMEILFEVHVTFRVEKWDFDEEEEVEEVDVVFLC